MKKIYIALGIFITFTLLSLGTFSYWELLNDPQQSLLGAFVVLMFLGTGFNLLYSIWIEWCNNLPDE